MRKLPLAIAIGSLCVVGVTTASAKSSRPGYYAEYADKGNQVALYGDGLSQASLKEDTALETANAQFSGKQGISAASVHLGPRLGVTNPAPNVAVTTPEPTTLLLLGTGLTAIGAYRRKKSQKSE